MKATSESITDLEIFRISLVNRPILVLKCEYGLVGYKNKTNFKLECNKSTFNVILLEESNDLNGFYCLKGFFLRFRKKLGVYTVFLLFSLSYRYRPIAKNDER